MSNDSVHFIVKDSRRWRNAPVIKFRELRNIQLKAAIIVIAASWTSEGCRFDRKNWNKKKKRNPVLDKGELQAHITRGGIWVCQNCPTRAPIAQHTTLNTTRYKLFQHTWKFKRRINSYLWKRDFCLWVAYQMKRYGLTCGHKGKTQIHHELDSALCTLHASGNQNKPVVVRCQFWTFIKQSIVHVNLNYGTITFLKISKMV